MFGKILLFAKKILTNILNLRRTFFMQEILNKQKKFYLSNQTKNIYFRLNQLKKLKSQIKVYYEQILNSYKKDLNKPEYAVLIEELYLVMRELNYMIKKLKHISGPKRYGVGFLNFGSKAFVLNDPYGNVLICCNTNTPLLHTLVPIIGCIAGGNTVTLCLNFKFKNIYSVIKKILDVFEDEYVFVTDDESIDNNIDKTLYDFVYVLGNYKQHLNSNSTLNMRKNICIVDEDCNIDQSVKSIVEAKFLSAGQSSFSPDYVLVHSNIKEMWVEKAIELVKRLYYQNEKLVDDYCKCLDKELLQKNLSDIDKNKVVFGGNIYKEDILEPTILNNVYNSFDKPFLKFNNSILNIIEFDDFFCDLLNLQKQDDLNVVFYFGYDKEKIKTLSEICKSNCCINGALTLCLDKNFYFAQDNGINNNFLRNKNLFYAFTKSKIIIKKGKLIKTEVLSKEIVSKYINLFKKILGL